MRDAVDAAIAGVTLEEIQTLDMGTQHASHRVNSAATRNARHHAYPAARTGRGARAVEGADTDAGCGCAEVIHIEMAKRDLTSEQVHE